MTRRKDTGKTKRKRRPPPPKPSVKSNAKLSANLNPQADFYATNLYTDSLYADDLYADSLDPDEAPLWIDDQGVHALLPGQTAPDAQMLQRMSETFQQKLRQSPLYQKLVQEYGVVKAEQIIQQCRAELR